MEGIALDYTDIKGSDEYDNAFRVCVSKAHKIEIGALRRLQPWKPKVPAVDFKCPAVELRIVVDHDAEGNISTPVDRLHLVLTHHAEFLYAMVPVAQSGRRKKPKLPPWEDIAQADDPSKWVDIKRLPPAPFELISPMLMKPKRLLEFGSHIIHGELELIEPEVHFRWLGQVDGPLTIPHRQRAVPKPDGEDGEEIMLDDVSASDSEAEEAEDSKTTRKRKTAGDALQPAPKRQGGGASARKKRKIQESPLGREPKVPPAKKQRKSAPKTKDNTMNQANAKSSKPAAGVSKAPKKPKQTGAVHKPKLAGHKGVPECDIAEDPAQMKHAQSESEEDGFLWRNDFTLRQDALDWESERASTMGCDVAMAARFIEATEVDEAVTLGVQLDLSAPHPSNETDIGELWDVLMQPHETMLAISAFHGVKDWTNVYDTVLERGRGLLRRILNHPTDALRARLKVGGNLGMFPALRCMEWMRRRLTLRDPDSTYSQMLHALLQECDLVLAQEQWRRWAITSFALPMHDIGWNQARGAVLLNAWLLWMECMMRTKPDGYHWFTSRWQSTMPGLVHEISKDAQLRERNVEPEHLCVRYSSSNWTRSTVIKEVKAWCQSMDESTFNNGSVVERFLWTYSVHMMSGMGQGEEAWCIEATTKGCEWLLKAAQTSEADILLKRAVVCRSVPAASEQAISKRNRMADSWVSGIGHGGNSSNNGDVRVKGAHEARVTCRGIASENSDLIKIETSFKQLAN
ncbi:hypothetical protein M422DRAFT_249345 [Sphaerobolus stellatus SS14]|uniref:Uncharacterized protein n=1 Tax=Sphaerobolus stellatus (strain SS14) TaxID=990650 RepID=A0A0C9W5I0_SPHS4|nr:hypothetical protein M422DRAFT_249345 [Sphaerobolus stellatus SS14]